MNTPGHAVVSVAIVEALGAPQLVLPVLIAAVLPDVPIAFLYLDARFRRGLPDERIWSEVYQERFWQDLVHGLHAFPVALLGALAAWLLASPWMLAFFISLAFHALLDFPIHAQDAHRHFFPFTHYRFISPLSYWDVRHHARAVVAVEMAIVLCAGVFLWPHLGVLGHALLAAVAAFYIDNYRRLFVKPQAPAPAARG